MRMTKWLGSGVAVATMWMAGSIARADTVSGEVVDLSCYLSHPHTSTGSGHRKCAETCAKKGLPMGILTEDGSVLLLLEDHANPKAYSAAIGKAATTVTVEGRKVSEGGLPGLVVESVQ